MLVVEMATGEMAVVRAAARPLAAAAAVARRA